MKIIAATKNKNKLREFGEILKGFEIISQEEAGIDIDVEETGTTFEENSLLKAQAIYEKSGIPAIADDSGLCVNALDGRPGVYSARYAGEDATDEEKIAKLLAELEDKTDRSAYFVSCVCCYFSEDDYFCVRGECHGSISSVPDGNGGFGYDPVFEVEGLNKTYARLTGEEKDACSHRGNALRMLRDKLKERFS